MSLKELLSMFFAVVSVFLFSARANALTPVVVTFQSEITQVGVYQGESEGNPDDYLPSQVSVGDTLIGYQVYDLDIATDDLPDNPIFGSYPAESVLCSGISVNGINVDISKTAEGSYMSIRDNANFVGVPSDQFIISSQDRLSTFLPEVNSQSYFNRNLMTLAFYTNSPDSNNPEIISSDSMQVMPTVGWENIQFSWEEYNSEISTSLSMQSYSTNFTVDVSQDVNDLPDTCELKPSIANPTAGSVLQSSDVQVQFADNGAAIDQWWLYVGSALGERDYFDSNNLMAQNNVLATGLPTDGSAVYMRLWYRQVGTPWAFIDAEYTSVAIEVLKPEVHSPASGSQFIDTEVEFTWNANGVGIDDWWLYVGSSEGASDYFDSGNIAAATSATVTGLPNDASMVYVRLWYRTVGEIWQSVDSTFTAVSNPDGPSITAPMDNVQLNSEAQTFSWNSNGATVTKWWFYVGSTPGGFQYFNSGSLFGSTSSVYVSNLPNAGETLYVQLWYFTNGGWSSKDYTYMAIDLGGAPEIVNPPDGGTLVGTSQTFVWQNNSASVDTWWMYVGSTAGGTQYLDSGLLQASSNFLVVDELPEDGSQVYVRLWYRSNGVWKRVDSQYVASSN